MNENKEENKESSNSEGLDSVYDMYYAKVAEQKFNLWISIWTEPRKTMRYIIDNQPRKYVLLIAIIYGILTYLENAASNNLGDRIPMWGIFLRAVVIGGLGGIVFLYILAGIIKWTGKLLKGKGTMEHIRASMAWSGLPYILVSVLWIPALILFGTDLFKSSRTDIEILSAYGIISTTFHFIALIWGGFLQFNCLGEVQGFSSWKAILNYLLTGIVSFFLFIIVVLCWIAWYGLACVL